MTIMVAPIVEGHGDVDAVPVLLRRILVWAGAHDFQIAKPWRLPSGKIFGTDDIEKAVKFLAAKYGNDAWIVAIFDCEDGCPARWHSELHNRIRTVLPNHRFSVVCAYREFETWFLASSRSLRGFRGMAEDAAPPDNLENIRDAKERLKKMLNPAQYRPAVDQAAFASRFSLDEARVCRSFRKLESEARKIAIALSQEH